MAIPTETPAYKKLEADVNSVKQLLFADRDKIIDFELSYPDGTVRVLHFRRLKSTEYDDVVGAMHKVGIDDEEQAKRATKEQMDQMYACYCLALGYGSTDGLNAQDWLELNDRWLVQNCFFKLMQISGVSKDALESLSWFRGQRGGTNEVGSVQNDE